MFLCWGRERERKKNTACFRSVWFGIIFNSFAAHHTIPWTIFYFSFEYEIICSWCSKRKKNQAKDKMNTHIFVCCCCCCFFLSDVILLGQFIATLNRVIFLKKEFLFFFSSFLFFPQYIFLSKLRLSVDEAGCFSIFFFGRFCVCLD